jgi:hypothetical protein
MQFDRHGNRVWRQAKALLDSEHTRRAVGEVAVPYGGCSEPTNVAAGGQDCPIRFRCVGCGHFSTDISYLPDLERYLTDLLRHRERLAATLDTDEWAKSEAMPSDEEIKRIRRLIDRMKGDLDELTDEERAQIEEAVGDVRRGRAKIVGLGIPRIRQPLPDLRAHRMTSSNPMIEGRRADSARRRQRVIKAINTASTSGEETSVSAIARAAGVDRTFLYRHADLLGQIHAAQASPTSADGGGPAVNRVSLQADLANAQGQITRQAARIRQLEKKLSELLGEQAWRESGLGAPDDIEQLKRRITDLEQQVVDLTGQLEERDKELDAARAANRELIANLNRKI